MATKTIPKYVAAPAKTTPTIPKYVAAPVVKAAPTVQTNQFNTNTGKALERGQSYVNSAGQTVTQGTAVGTFSAPAASAPAVKAPNDPSNIYNTATGQINTNYAGYVAPVVAPEPIYKLSPEDQAAKDAAANYVAIYNADTRATVDPATEYANTLKLYQGSIDASNKVYADKLNAARIQGQGRVESAQFANGRAGQIGSGVGQANANSVQDANTEVNNSILNEQDAAVQTILGKVTDTSLAAVKDKTTAKKAGADALLAYYDNKPARDAANLKPIIASLVAKNIDPLTLSASDLASITTGLGVSKEAVQSAYNDALTVKKTAETAATKAQAELDQTLAQTAKTTADTAIIGKMTPSDKANLAEKIREFGITSALDKWKAENPTKVATTTYDSSTIPEQTKADLFATMKAFPKDTFNDLAIKFPELDTKYLADIINNQAQ